ncbi:MAG: FAD:protein FMN transferase [Flavobacteriales bacterium]|nr:FAD:protein FMN transferase [Flavobacteriales bacterium]
MRFAIVIVCWLVALCLPAIGQVSVSRSTKLMGSAFAFTAVHSDTVTAQRAIDAAIAEVQRIENVISEWMDGSETSSINRNAGISPVSVSDELIRLIQRSKKISQVSNGYFDISFASIDNIWWFDGRVMPAPDAALVARSVKRIGYEKIIVDPEKGTVFLQDEGMKIGFGGIGKGYAANRAKQVMLDMGVTSGVVNAGGDLIAWGPQIDGKPWSIGIADPKEKTNILAWTDVTDMAVVTSGSYEKFVVIDGKRHGHIIDPKTGWPATGLLSVTIFCPDAELADALATTVFVLGKEDGLKLVNHLEDVECILIDEDMHYHYSNNIETRLK